MPPGAGAPLLEAHASAARLRDRASRWPSGNSPREEVRFVVSGSARSHGAPWGGASALAVHCFRSFAARNRARRQAERRQRRGTRGVPRAVLREARSRTSAWLRSRLGRHSNTEKDDQCRTEEQPLIARAGHVRHGWPGGSTCRSRCGAGGGEGSQENGGRSNVERLSRAPCKGRDLDDVVAAAVRIIVYGVTTEEELQGMAGQPPIQKNFRDTLAEEGLHRATYVHGRRAHEPRSLRLPSGPPGHGK